jgi:hypothetical protein
MNSENFSWVPKGKSLGNINIFDITVTVNICCQINCLLYHCYDSIYRTACIIKYWLSSSCILNVCAFHINKHFSLWAVNFVHFTYQIWSRLSG